MNKEPKMYDTPIRRPQGASDECSNTAHPHKRTPTHKTLRGRWIREIFLTKELKSSRTDHMTPTTKSYRSTPPTTKNTHLKQPIGEAICACITP